MKILGIGNAIVDVLCKVDDDFLVKNSLTKSTMKLIDKDEFKTLLSLSILKKLYQGDQLLIL
jgi:fructokinase